MRFLSSILTLLVAAGLNAAPPPKPVILNSDVTGSIVLRKTKQPHEVSTSITVLPTGKLVVERGATIAVAGGSIMTLFTNIEIIGEGTERVRFVNRDSHRAWGGFVMGDKAELTLSDLHIVGADIGINRPTGEGVGGAKLTLIDSWIETCEVGVLLRANRFRGRQELRNCVFFDCREYGLHCAYFAKVDIDRCSFGKRGKSAILFGDGNDADVKRSLFDSNEIAITTNGRAGQISIKGCSFLNPQLALIDHKTSKPVHARSNYWGTKRVTDIAAMIRDVHDGFPDRGQVDFAEFLQAAPKPVGSSLNPEDR